MMSLSSSASAIPYQVGDIFVGTGNGKIDVYDSTGTLLQTLDTTSSSAEQTGMCFDGSGNLYATSFSAGTMSKFDNAGLLLTYPWGGPFSIHPESCVVDGSGNIYTGEVDGTNTLRKFDSSGILLGQWNPATESRGIDWIDLAADQKTMYYTSEGTSIKRFDVSTNTQLADFATGLTRPCFALRILANGEVLVACSSAIYRLDSTGGVMQTYPGVNYGETSFFALNIDPDGTSFWTAGYSSGNVYNIDIITGNLITSFNAPHYVSVAGLAIFGEPTVSKPPEITLNPPEAENPAGTSHIITATVTTGGNPVPGILVSFEVINGPNVGQVSDPNTLECSPNSDCTTDSSGQVSWKYTSNGVVGTDVILGSYIDDNGEVHYANKIEKNWIDGTPPRCDCVETVNPGGKQVPQAPGKGQNEDGFYELRATDNVDPNPQIFVVDTGSGTQFGPFSSGTKIKYTEANGATPNQKAIGGPNSAVAWHIKGTGDAAVFAVDAADNKSPLADCLVPPPPK